MVIVHVLRCWLQAPLLSSKPMAAVKQIVLVSGRVLGPKAMPLFLLLSCSPVSSKLALRESTSHPAAACALDGLAHPSLSPERGWGPHHHQAECAG